MIACLVFLFGAAIGFTLIDVYRSAADRREARELAQRLADSASSREAWRQKWVDFAHEMGPEFVAREEKRGHLS